MSKKRVYIILLFLILSCTLPSLVLATSNEEGNVEPEAIEELSEANLSEIEDERSEFSKTFTDEEGNLTKEIYVEPIHNEVNGEWTDISTDLKLDKREGELKTESAQLEAAYPSKISSNEKIIYTFEEHTLEFSDISATDGTEKYSLNIEATTSYEENKILYKNILPGIDLRHVSLNNEVKEDWIIHDYQGIHQFNYEVTTDLIANLENDGSIGFYEGAKKGEKVFALPAPMMEDSNTNSGLGNGVKSADLHYELTSTSTNVYQINLVVDKGWLEDESRVFPVYVDPSVTIDALGDSFVSSATPMGNFNKQWNAVQGEYVLKVGNYDASTGTNYAFMKFSVVEELKNAVVDSASLKVFVTHAYDETASTGLWVDKVNASWFVDTVTWNNKPSSTNITNTSVSRDQWATLNVKQTIQDWINGTYGNYGFKFHTNGYGQTYWKQLTAAESANKAKLVVNYHYETPEKPAVTGYSINKDTGYFDLSWKKSVGAIGYKVAIFNGKDYQNVDVGDTTTWSTKGQKLWPTPTEIAAGKYLLKTDGTGSEFAVDPSKVYENAYNAGASVNYSGRQNYWFRVKAVYPGGDSPMSIEDKPTLPLGQPTLSGSIASGIPYYSGGAADLKWDAVAGATGYKVAVYNGKEYEEFDVGLATNWTSKGEKIWPTKEEIALGGYKLHHDKKGDELSLDPSPVYVNSNGVYPTRTNYWFKIIAYSVNGHPDSKYSNLYTPTIPIQTFTNITLNKGLNFVEMNWTGVPSATSYKIAATDATGRNIVYTGSINSFKHTNLMSGDIIEYKLYAYDSTGETLDIAKVNTATLFSDGLNDIFVDSIITTRKVTLIWNQLPNVKEYSVYKDGILLETTPSTQFIDENMKIGSVYNYTIESQEDLSVEKISEDLTLDTSAYSGTLTEGVLEENTNPLSPDTVEASAVENQPIVEESLNSNAQTYNMTLPIDTTMEDLFYAAAALPSKTTIRYRTFIPQAYLPVYFNIYYKGDNRVSNNRAVFSATSGTVRTKSDVAIDWTIGNGCSNGQVKLSKYIAPSSKYIKQSNGTYKLDGTLTASGNKLTVLCHYRTSSVAKYHISHSVGVPFMANMPPNIDYTYVVTVYRNGVTSVRGNHDKFPAHEMYRSNGGSWSRLYEFDPLKHGTTPKHLWPNYGNAYLNFTK